MTLTLEIAPEIEAALETAAARQGQNVTDYALALLLEAAEDASDATEVARARAEIRPEDLVSWEQLKAESGL